MNYLLIPDCSNVFYVYQLVVHTVSGAVQEVYGQDANKWIVYWRLFYIACSELFNLKGGEEYGAHLTTESPLCMLCDVTSLRA